MATMATPPIPEWVIKKDGGVKEKGYTETNWALIPTAPSLVGRFTFLHTCTFNLSTKQIVVMGGAKEFGEGFYTTCADIDEPYTIIAKEWFQKKQERYDWHVIAFTLTSDFLLGKLLGKEHKDNVELAGCLSFYLTHSVGYPSRNKNPNAADLEGINRINRLGRVLIFPHDKSQKVDYCGWPGDAVTQKSWENFTEGKAGGGAYRLVIGPQQPEYMHEYRQYAWTPGWGIWMINNATRFCKFRNYQIISKQRKPLKKGDWPAKHPVIDENGSKM